MREVKVYIASPYCAGDKQKNAELQMDAAYHLLMMGFKPMGFNPYAPLYNHYVQIRHDDINKTFPRIEIDLSWLKECDIMVRLHTVDENEVELPSVGADMEEAFAKEHEIPVIHCNSLDELVQTFLTLDNQVE